MPKEKATVTFYNISQCGFFKFGDKAPLYGSTEELMKEVKEWSDDKALIETYLYEPKNDLLPVYLFDIKEKNSDWLITMWNQVPSNGQSVASVMGDSQVGRADVVMNAVAEGSIPGFATYFWIIPQKKIFATIRFQHLITAQKAMQEYMESFLEIASSHACIDYDEDDNILNHNGFIADQDTEDEEPNQRIHPRFRTELVRRPGKHDLIRNNAHQVSRVERNTMLKLNNAEELDWWQRLMRFTSIHIPNDKPDRMRLRYRLTTSVTEDDVNSIIEAWEDNQDKQWDDYGFVFRGSSEIHWLSKSLARDEIEIEIKRSNDEVVDADSLIDALSAMKADLIKLAKG